MFKIPHNFKIPHEESVLTLLYDMKRNHDDQGSRIVNLEKEQVNIKASLKTLENQMGQLAHSIKENFSKSFPSDVKKNPRECKAITLRSRKELEDPKTVEKKKVEIEKEKARVDKKEEKKEKDKFTSGRITFPDNPPLIVPPLPFPRRFKKAKLDEQFAKFLNIKKLEVNIPFANALAQMSNYVKFMKEIMSNKKKLDASSIVSLSEKCSAIIQRKLPKKLKDPGSFTIRCMIGEYTFSKALCDLEASNKLMPLLVVKKLNLGELTSTTLSLQMEDRSLTFPKGIIEDVLVKVDKFIFPVDFVVQVME